MSEMDMVTGVTATHLSVPSGPGTVECLYREGRASTGNPIQVSPPFTISGQERTVFITAVIADDFVSALTERFAQVAVGSGLGKQTALGPLIDDRAVAQMQAHTNNAVSLGATLLTGGHGYDSAGNLFAPTVPDRVTDDSDVAQSEIFGPIAAIPRFSSEDEAVTRANATEFGLAGYVFTENLDRASTSRTASKPESWASTKAYRPTPAPRSEASSSQASDAKEAQKASKNTRTSASTTWRVAPLPSIGDS